MQSNKLVKIHDQVIGVTVKNDAKETLGKIKEIMVNKRSGQTTYVVLEVDSFLGIGGKLFVLPWGSIHYNTEEECFLIDVNLEKDKWVSSAPSFDKDEWPDMADKQWEDKIYQYYGSTSHRQH